MCIHNILRFIYTIINLFPFHSWSCLHKKIRRAKKNMHDDEKKELHENAVATTPSGNHNRAVYNVLTRLLAAQSILTQYTCMKFDLNISHPCKMKQKKSILMLLRWRWRWRWCKGNKIKWCKSNFREIKSENIFPSVQFTCPFRCRHFFFFFRFFFCSHSFGCIFLVSLTLPLLILLSFALFSPSLFFG